MKNFNIGYHNHNIRVEAGDNYRLTFPDGRWLVVDLKEDYSKTIASSDAAVRQHAPSEWVITSTSGGPDWINSEQLQVVGELINRKTQELQRQDALA